MTYNWCPQFNHIRWPVSPLQLFTSSCPMRAKHFPILTRKMQTIDLTVFFSCKSRHDGIKEMENICIICIQKQSRFLAEVQRHKRLEVWRPQAETAQSNTYVSLNAASVARAFQQKCDISRGLIVCSPSAFNITVVYFVNWSIALATKYPKMVKMLITVFLHSKISW